KERRRMRASSGAQRLFSKGSAGGIICGPWRREAPASLSPLSTHTPDEPQAIQLLAYLLLACVCVCVFVCLYVCVRVSVCVCVCVCATSVHSPPVAHNGFFQVYIVDRKDSL